jgi:hypothetical protein
MQRLNSTYALWFNKKHQQVGHVLQGRFHSVLVEKESYLLEVARYIVLNPVRAGIVSDPAHWMWSSYRATAGFLEPPEFLTTSMILSHFRQGLRRSRHDYQVFVRQGMGMDLWRQLRGGIILGSDAFLQSIEQLTDGRGLPREVPGRERQAARPSLDHLLGNAGTIRERNRLIRLAIRVYEYKQKDIASWVGLSPSRISEIARGDDAI